jgi:hypothetical protein
MLPGPVDVDYDFRIDTKGDPDTESETLARYQALLLSKPLPSGETFTLTVQKTRGYSLLHESPLGRFVLTSDTILNSNKGPCAEFYAQMPDGANAHWHGAGIGARVAFPMGGHGQGRVGINQDRGTNHLIKDRFDLTLECIRRHYQGGESPLASTLARYADFFELFGTFQGYVEFFLLEDWVDENFDVRFYLESFPGFESDPLPKTFEDYVTFRNAQLERLQGRKARINAFQDQHLR